MGGSFLCGIGTDFLALFGYISIISVLNGIKSEKEHGLSTGMFMTPVDSDSPFWHTVAMDYHVIWIYWGHHKQPWHDRTLIFASPNKKLRFDVHGTVHR